MPDVRVETDALGSVVIPCDALWGIQTARSLENLSFSRRALGACPAYVQALALVKRAAARANREAGVLEGRVADAIDASAAAVQEGRYGEQFPVDLLGGGGSIAINMNLNEVLANLASERLGGRRGAYDPVHPLRHVNASQSTADVCHTGVRLALHVQAARLQAALAGLGETLAVQAGALATVPTLARTCLQDALPTTLGVLFDGYTALIRRRSAELGRSLAALDAVALGGTVIGTGEGASPAYRARVVPILAALAERSLTAGTQPADALQNSDDVAAISAQLALLAQALLKLARDLRLLSSGPRGGFGELALPAVQAGSSFFDGKVNPVVPETVMQCAFQVLGCDRAVQAAAEHAELYLNVFDGFAAANVLDAIDMLANTVESLDVHCLRGLRANEERCRELAGLATKPPL